MIYLPFFPLFRFLSILFSNGSLSRRGILNCAKWILKIAVIEPFRLIDVIFFTGRVRRHRVADDPIFILGHYRSGTTYLHGLIASDPRFGALDTYGMLFPEIYASTGKLLGPVLKRLIDALRIEAVLHQKMVDIDDPAEEDVAIMTLGGRETPYWGLLFPKKCRDYHDRYMAFTDGGETAIDAWRKTYLDMIEKISFVNDGRPLVLKCPSNTGRVPQLLTLFPKASFIYIHRNPYDMFKSCSSFWDVVRRNAFQDINENEARELVFDIYSQMTHAYLAHRSLISNDRLIELRFEDLVADPGSVLERIYERFSIPAFEKARPHILAYAAKQSFTPKSYSLTPRDVSDIQSRWASSLTVWPYPVPSPADGSSSL